MRAAAIFGLGCSPNILRFFQIDPSIEFHTGLPSSRSDADIVLIFGGDGTIHHHLPQFVQLQLPVLIVPAGSGNDFARALGLRRMRDSLAAWRKFCATRENVKAIDLGLIQPLTEENKNQSQRTGAPAPHFFCSVAGIGLDAEVSRRANRLPRWLRARGGYVLALAATMFRFAPHPMTIESMEIESLDEATKPSTRSDQPTLLAAFANTAIYGGGMKIAPRATLDDGLLDVCVIAGMNRFRLAALFPTVYSGRHLQIREIEYFQAARLRVETEMPLDIYADGEYVCSTPAEISIQPEALKVVIS